MSKLLSIVDDEAVARLTADEATARAAGFALEPPVYALGTLVNETGARNFRASRAEFEALPYAVDALDALRVQVAAEDRQDLLVPVKSLGMADDGRLDTPIGLLPFAEPAFERFASAIAPAGGRYLAACPAWLRARNVNHWVQANGDKEVQLRHRKAGDGRAIFAVTGPRYASHDVDKVAAQLVAGVPGGTRADLVYDGYRARFNLVGHSNVVPEKVAAGEIFRAAAAVTAEDTGKGALTFSGEVLRNLCRNLIILHRARAGVGRRVHVGAATIADDVAAGIANAFASVSAFIGQWNTATVENVIERYEVEGPEAIFRGLVYNKLVWAPGVGVDGMVERLQRAWDQEPGYSKAAFVNAITRAAHEEPWTTPWVTEEIERSAGELLYAKVWNVQLPEVQ